MYKKSLYENIMKDVSKVIKKYLNEALLQWSEEDIELEDNPNDILKTKEVSREMRKVDIRELIPDVDYIIEESLDEYPELKNEDYISLANNYLTDIFKTPQTFLEFVRKCIIRDWEHVCETDYSYLDDNGWNIYITDTIEEILKEYQNDLNNDEIEEWIFGHWGLIWYMVQENALDIELKDHPQGDL